MTLMKMLLEIAEKDANWRYYVEDNRIVGANQSEDLYCAADTLEEVLTKIWLHYYGKKENKLTEKYFSESDV
jgi:hypothetical protein